MFNPPGFKDNCPYCKSPRIEYCGYVLGAMRFYYRCSNCGKYIKYRTPSKQFLIMNLIVFLVIVFAVVPSLFLLSISPLFAILFFFAFVVLCLIIGNRYGRFFFKAFVIEELPDDLLTIQIHEPSYKIRRIVTAILSVVLLAYIAIFIINLLRQ